MLSATPFIFLDFFLSHIQMCCQASTLQVRELNIFFLSMVFWESSIYPCISLIKSWELLKISNQIFPFDTLIQASGGIPIYPSILKL